MVYIIVNRVLSCYSWAHYSSIICISQKLTIGVEIQDLLPACIDHELSLASYGEWNEILVPISVDLFAHWT